MLEFVLKLLLVALLTYLVGQQMVAAVITGTTTAEMVMDKLLLPAVIVGVVFGAVMYYHNKFRR